MKSIFFAATLALFGVCSANAANNKTCPPGFDDTGSHCLKPSSKGRGFGNSTMAHCEETYGQGNCERCLLLYYPICPEFFEARGCNVCEPQCPPNMTDVGLMCQK